MKIVLVLVVPVLVVFIRVVLALKNFLSEYKLSVTAGAGGAAFVQPCRHLPDLHCTVGCTVWLPSGAAEPCHLNPLHIH